MADKGSNPFDECAAQWVHLCPQEEECTSSSWGDSKCTYLAPQQIHRRADKNGAVAPLRNSVAPPSKNFNGARDSIRHLKISRVISNEMPVLLLILCWCYFSCLKMYSEKFLMLTFMSKCFLKSLWQRETQLSIFWKIIAWTVKFSLTNLHVSWRSWF